MTIEQIKEKLVVNEVTTLKLNEIKKLLSEFVNVEFAGIYNDADNNLILALLFLYNEEIKYANIMIENVDKLDCKAIADAVHTSLKVV